MSKEIVIKITGTHGVGTTVVARQIEKVLVDVGLNVYFTDEDNPNINLDNFENLDDKLESIRLKDVDIHLETKNVVLGNLPTLLKLDDKLDDKLVKPNELMYTPKPTTNFIDYSLANISKGFKGLVKTNKTIV